MFQRARSNNGWSAMSTRTKSSNVCILKVVDHIPSKLLHCLTPFALHTDSCEHRFCSQTKTRGDRNCTACFSLANIFNQSTNKSFGAKLQSEVSGGFTRVRIGNLINQSATSCAILIPPLLEDCSEQKTFKDVARRRLR